MLLSDGETTVGRPNDQAAKAAKAQDVPVHTIAFGTDSGSVRAPDGQQVKVPVNRAALQKLANQTGGRYFPAASAEQLKQVYEQLGRSVTTKTPVKREVGDWFGGAAIALLGPRRRRLAALVQPPAVAPPAASAGGLGRRRRRARA